MTTNHHTPLQNGDPATAATFNAVSSDLDFAIVNIISGSQKINAINYGDGNLLIIDASGALPTINYSYIPVRSFSGTTDTLVNMQSPNPRAKLVVLRADTGHTITVSTAGNIYTPSGNALIMSDDDYLILSYNDYAPQIGWHVLNETGQVTDLADLGDVSAAADTANFVLATPDGSTGDYSGRALVVDDLPFDLPQRATMWHDEAQVVSGNTFTVLTNTSNTYNFEVFQNSPANGDSFYNAFWLRAGTYDFKFLGSTVSSGAQVQWAVRPEGGTFSNIGGVQEWYSAATVRNVVQTIASIALSADGYYVLRGTVTGKNGSSSNYFVTLQKYWIVPTGGF